MPAELPDPSAYAALPPSSCLYSIPRFLPPSYGILTKFLQARVRDTRAGVAPRAQARIKTRNADSPSTADAHCFITTESFKNAADAGDEPPCPVTVCGAESKCGTFLLSARVRKTRHLSQAKNFATEMYIPQTP